MLIIHFSEIKKIISMPGITIRFITIALKPVAFSFDKISLKKLSKSSAFCRMPYLKENTHLLLATFISFPLTGVLGIFVVLL